MCLCLGGCSPTGSREVALESTVADSNLVKPGTLTVGVDSTDAPFGGTSNGVITGSDVGVAAAIANQLGLKLNVVDTSGKNARTLLNNKEIDIAMSMPTTQSADSGIALVGPYMQNAPALFGKNDTGVTTSTFDLTTLNGKKVGAYKSSIAANAAATYCGLDNVVPFSSLTDAFDALQSGKVDYVAADSVAGGYLSFSYGNVDCLALLQNPNGIYMGILQSNTALTNAVTGAVNDINQNGVLKVVVSKWVSQQCAQYVMPSTSVVATATQTTDTEGSDATASDQSAAAQSATGTEQGTTATSTAGTTTEAAGQTGGATQ